MNLVLTSELLPKKTAISVFDRWLREFGISGSVPELQGRIFRSASVVGSDAVSRFTIGKEEKVHLLVEYDKSHMEAYSVVGCDVGSCLASRSDLVILRTDFSGCLVINHEDGNFWDGPAFLQNKESKQSVQTATTGGLILDDD